MPKAQRQLHQVIVGAPKTQYRWESLESLGTVVSAEPAPRMAWKPFDAKVRDISGNIYDESTEFCVELMSSSSAPTRVPELRSKSPFSRTK